jgi:Tuberculosis necrotizing toxin
MGAAAGALASVVLAATLSTAPAAYAAAPAGHPAAALVAAPTGTATSDVAGLPPGLTQCSTTYADGDPRLGPARFPLPFVSEIGTELLLYQRTGGKPVATFLATYYDPAANGGRGGWRYPPDNGYLTGPGGAPIEAPQTLVPGQDIDRFGSEYGAFLSPRDTPYAQRAIPPQSLDTYDPAYTCNYHQYRVLQPFAVEAGPIAPWFGQPGGGRQFQLVAGLVPGAPSPLSVQWLVSNGYLARLN